VTGERLRTLVAYNRWANTRLLEAAGKVSAEDFVRDLGASFGSLQGTLIHILWGERGWLRFWQVGAFVPRPGPGEYPDFLSLRSAWASHQLAYDAYLLGVTEAELDTPRTLDVHTYTLGELAEHILNHSTYHRGQVAVLLRQLGHVPPSTGYRHFLTDAAAHG
jgi:uncharacterized damage-inducible protein DinB